MYISKYILYVAVLALATCICLTPKWYKLATYKQVKGYVSHFETRCNTSKNGRGWCNRYPVVEYEAEGYAGTLMQTSNAASYTYAGKTIAVLYEPGNPANAFTYDFWGIYYYYFLAMVPGFLIWTAMIFNPDIFKKKVKLW